MCALAAVLTASAAEPADTDRLAREARAAETAFAKSMADRDLAAFAALVDDEAVFFGGKVLRGKAAVVADWKKFFEGPQAPFSWEPKEVEVLDSGHLAISSGPVRAPDGKQVGVFNSIWRRGADGQWKVIFDKGCPPCDCAKKPDA
jgi:ketosteroid isomerase-like protein